MLRKGKSAFGYVTSLPTGGVPRLVDRGPCPLCGSGSSTPAISFTDIPVVRCTRCHFLYSGRVMTEHALAAYYAEQITNERLQCGQEVYAKASLAALERLTPLPRLRRVLDVGSGYGFLLASLRSRHGVDGIGVEPSVVESEYGRACLGVDIRTSMLLDAGLPPAAFDLVFSFEVLEHTMNPPAFLTELAEYVVPGGFLVIGTDNFESAVVQALGPAFPKWIPHTHISHFTPATLRLALGQLDGFSVAGYVSYTPWEFLARRLIAPLRRTPLASDAYDLASGITQEVARDFRYYRLRKAITGRWFRYTATTTLAGEMMYIALQKQNADR